MTAAELIRELGTFQPDSEVLVAIGSPIDWQSAIPGVVYWDTDARKVIIEAEQGV